MDDQDDLVEEADSGLQSHWDTGLKSFSAIICSWKSALRRTILLRIMSVNIELLSIEPPVRNTISDTYVIGVHFINPHLLQYTKNIKEQEDLIDTMIDQLSDEKIIVNIKQKTISEPKEHLRKKDFENEHLKSKVIDFTTVQNLQARVKELQSEDEHLKPKVVDCTMCQNHQVQVKKLKSVSESLNLSVEELYKEHALAEVTLRERDELSVELVVRFSDEKYFALKEIESLKDEIESLQIENQDLKSRESELNNLEKVYETKESVLLKDIDQMKSQVSKLVVKLQISDQEMKQQIILFEEDKRMFLAKNEFLEKVSSSVQQEYNDLLASNDVLKQILETKFKFLKHNNSLKKMVETIEKELTNLRRILLILKKKTVLAQRVKDFDDVKTELSKRIDKFEMYFPNLEKENALLKLQLAS
nr:hypothetical protein [Tanacetum cinerariifolium]